MAHQICVFTAFSLVARNRLIRRCCLIHLKNNIAPGRQFRVAKFFGINFPILTFDVAKLTPSWGYVFDARWLDPYESVVSMLWKLIWMNRLAGHAVVGHIAMQSVDPYAVIGITHEEINGRYLATTLGIRLKTVRQSIGNPVSRRAPISVLRYCARCMARGYHSAVDQFGNVTRCPIHATLLETHCRCCGAASDYRIEAKMLDASFKCPNCRRSYSPSWSSFTRCRRLQAYERTAVTRTFIGC